MIETATIDMSADIVDQLEEYAYLEGAELGEYLTPPIEAYRRFRYRIEGVGNELFLQYLNEELLAWHTWFKVNCTIVRKSYTYTKQECELEWNDE